MREQHESSDSAHTAHTAQTRLHDQYQPYVVMKSTEAKQREYKLLHEENKTGEKRSETRFTGETNAPVLFREWSCTPKL